MELQAQAQRILLPAKVSFIVLTLALSLVQPVALAHVAGVPDLTRRWYSPSGASTSRARWASALPGRWAC